MTDLGVLHVLPHPGGGGERYVDALCQMSGFRFDRLYLAASREPLPALPRLASTVPRVNLHAERYDLVHVHGEIAGFLCLPALARRPSVVTLHGLSFVRRSTMAASKVAAINLRLLVSAATKTISVSPAEESEIIEIVGESAAAKLDLVPLGVEARSGVTADERSAARAALETDAGMVVVMVGALDYPKDPLTAARAALAAAESGLSLTLLVAGEGSLRSQVEELARDSGGIVRLLGHRDDVPRLLAAADAFVLSSRHEGLPYALLDAMAAGLPSIVTDYPGARDAVSDAGLIVPRKDVSAMAQALRQLTGDPAERRALGERARARATEIFSQDAMVERTRAIYGEVSEPS
jgi:glycosyltransferase involved in cell wall biosynthesis